MKTSKEKVTRKSGFGKYIFELCSAERRTSTKFLKEIEENEEEALLMPQNILDELDLMLFWGAFSIFKIRSKYT